MSDLTFALLVLLAGILLAATALAAAVALDNWLQRRRRDRQGMTDREVANSIDPGEYGVDISVWPSRAPRNGSAHEDVA